MRPTQAPAPVDKMAHFQKLCREQGVPLTLQRRAILEVLADREDHPTADGVFEAVAKRLPGLSRTTVYRGLETLVQLGVVQKAAHIGSAARYDPRTDRHHHLTCVGCHQVVDVEDDPAHRVHVPKASAKGFEVLDYSVQFKGYCPSCLRKGRSGRSGRK
jgi:Fur family transcriptional regulator, peroxide stress response regulator